MRAIILKLCVLAFFLTACFPVLAIEPADSNAVTLPNAKAAVITCNGMIDDGLYSSIKRRADIAIADGATYLIFEISTYGGLVKSADDISKYLILELSQKAHTVAFVTTEAISAGAMISVSCQDIIMKPNTTIGDCAPIQMGEKLEGVEREKVESFIRATFQRAAEANNYPPALLESMVSRHKKIYRIKNTVSGEFEFFEEEKMPSDTNSFSLESKELIISENEILTLTAAKAKEYGIARAVAADVDEGLAFFETRDNVDFGTDILRLEPNWSEQLVRKLNHPSVTSILFMIGLLGVYIEFKTPGLGLPGLVAVICFTILFGSRFLVGLATWWEMAVFFLGIVLLLVEIFVIPGFGVAGIAGIFCILVGMFAILVPNRPDELPWPRYDFGDVQWQILERGVWAFCFGFAGFVVLAYILAKYLPNTGPFRGLLLSPAQRRPKMDISITSPPASQRKTVNVGDSGTAVTELRPAGEAKFADCVVDVVAEGVFIEKNQKVIITEIHGNRVVVKVAGNPKE
ncbi:MAG: hypothetical protein K8R02_05855 [Anaerohalosphaeraceae bacterium]|nr:hypothetical protein [Anaerohalosphaeraceae bacterium]